MNWYKIRPHGLPDIHFEVADMRDYVKRAPAGSKRQVYVAANALGYIAQQYGPKGFVRVLQDIQNNNRGKETYVVVGQVEHQVFKQAPQLVEFMKALGYEPVSQEQLKAWARLKLTRRMATSGK